MLRQGSHTKDESLTKERLLAQIAQQQKEQAALQQTQTELEQQIATLKEQVAWFRKHVFGRSSEKRNGPRN